MGTRFAAFIRFPLSGGSPTTIAAGGFVTVDDTCIYYADLPGLGGGIYSVDKSYASASP